MPRPGKKEKPQPTTAPVADRPRRRNRLAVGVAVAVTLLSAAGVIFWRSGPPQADLRGITGQNILLITIDTLRADALGCYGGPAATPALDGLASEGVRFDFAHTHAVITLPAHASILTGLYPYQHGIRDNSGYRLSPDTPTAATLLKRSGYRTAAFVASFTLDARFGLNAGFDLYDDRLNDAPGPSDFNMPERPASAVVPLARKWISAQTAGADARPWLAWVHVFDPHAPYRPPAPFDAQYADRPYYGEVAAVDAALAPLLDDVRRSGKPTIVIVTGDHGEGLGEHGEEAHGLFAYESTLRVPLIIAELGRGSAPKAGPGEVSSVSARHVDILPTLLEAAAQPVPAGLPGRSLLPGRERLATAAPRSLYFEAMASMLNHGWAPLSGVLTGHDKFIELPSPERYDLAHDRLEQANLFGKAPERDRVLAASLAAFNWTLPGQRLAEDKDTVARLRSLGYVSAQAAPKTRYTEQDDPKRLVELDRDIHHAINAFNDGRTDDAEKLYRSVIERRPDMPIAYRRLAFIEWQRGRVSAAVDILRKGVSRGITDPRLLAQLGEYLSDQGHLAEGIRMLSPLTDDPATEADASNALGIAYARSGRAPEARQMFERLIAMLPHSSAPLENLGVLALQQGDTKNARQFFDRAIALSPDSSRAHGGAGATAFQEGDRPSAYASWLRAIQLDASNFDALYSLAINLANDGRMAEARPYLEQFLRTAPPAAYPEQLKTVNRLLLQ